MRDNIDVKKRLELDSSDSENEEEINRPTERQSSQAGKIVRNHLVSQLLNN